MNNSLVYVLDISLINKFAKLIVHWKNIIKFIKPRKIIVLSNNENSPYQKLFTFAISRNRLGQIFSHLFFLRRATPLKIKIIQIPSLSVLVFHLKQIFWIKMETNILVYEIVWMWIFSCTKKLKLESIVKYFSYSIHSIANDFDYG